MEVDSEESPLALSSLGATLDGGDVEGDERSGCVRYENTVLVHIDIDLASLEVSRELTDGLIGLVFVHLLDLLLLDSKVEFTSFVFLHQLLDEVIVNQGLVLLSSFNISKVSDLLRGLGTQPASSRQQLLGLVESVLNDFIAATAHVRLLRFLALRARLFLLFFSLLRLLLDSRGCLLRGRFLGLFLRLLFIKHI